MFRVYHISTQARKSENLAFISINPSQWGSCFVCSFPSYNSQSCLLRSGRFARLPLPLDFVFSKHWCLVIGCPASGTPHFGSWHRSWTHTQSFCNVLENHCLVFLWQNHFFSFPRMLLGPFMSIFDLVSTSLINICQACLDRPAS